MEHATTNEGTRYPPGSPLYEPSLYQGDEIREQLDCAPTTCFSEGDNVDIRVIDIGWGDDTSFFNEKSYSKASDVEQVLMTSPDPRIRVISIHSDNTRLPLQINSALMLKILERYQIAIEFVPILFSFGEDPDPVESSNSTIFVQSSQDGTEHKLSYELRYREDNKRGQSNPWSLRHTGIYHHSSKGFDLFILLQSTPASTAERRLLRLKPDSATNIRDRDELCNNPFRMHLLLASSYLLNWRWYFRVMAHEFKDMHNKAMVHRPADSSMSFNYVQDLRNIQDRVLSSRACCTADLQILRGLLNVKDSRVQQLEGFRFHEKQLEGFIDSADVLLGRVGNTNDLIGYSINHQNQLESAKVNTQLQESTGQIERLAYTSVQNSATVTIITLLSAIYLPGSFVAAIFGTNFFSFDTQKHTIMIADDFWIFVLFWLPLTVVTGVFFYVVRKEARKTGSHDWPWLIRMLWSASSGPPEKA